MRNNKTYKATALAVLFSITGMVFPAHTAPKDTLPWAENDDAAYNQVEPEKKSRTYRKIILTQNSAGAANTPGNRVEYENQKKKDINNWTLGIAAGNSWGTPTRMATELANVVDDGKNLHVIPMASRGPASNIDALLYLRGVDMAIINADVLNHYKKEKAFLNINKRINYIAQLFLSELHILARKDIKSLKDLEGKVVNFNSRGTSASFSGPEIFKRLGVKVRQSFLPNQIALEQMKKNRNIAAIIYMSGKPIATLNSTQLPKDVHLLPAKYSGKLTDNYLPTLLKSEDYPHLVPKGKIISTVAVPSLLTVYNWKTNSKRYLKVERFIQYMLKRWKTFQSPSFHEKWKAINLNATIPGWKRFPAMQEQLDLMARLNRDSAIRTARRTNSNDSDKKLKIAFDRFLRNYARANGLSKFTPSQREKLFKQFHKFWRETRD